MPLRDVTVLLTRSAEANAELAAMFAKRGARTVSLPTIKIVEPTTWNEVDRAIDQLDNYNGIFFTSRNAVDRFLMRINLVNPDARTILSQHMIFAVGENTETGLEEAGLKATMTPEVYSAEALVESLGDELVKGGSFLFPKSDIGKDVIPSFLRSAGAEVDEIVVYRNISPQGVDLDRVRNALVDGSIHVASFFSPSAVRRSVQMLGSQCFASLPIAVIGETTGAAARSVGLAPSIVAENATAESMVEAIEEFFMAERDEG